MRLTTNNIAYVTENHLSTKKVTWAVMPKNHCMGDARFYEDCSIEELPKAVQKFIREHNCELLDHNEHFGCTKYIYR